jgi:hypothetical protein
MRKNGYKGWPLRLSGALSIAGGVRSETLSDPGTRTKPLATHCLPQIHLEGYQTDPVQAVFYTESHDAACPVAENKRDPQIRRQSAQDKSTAADRVYVSGSRRNTNLLMRWKFRSSEPVETDTMRQIQESMEF